MGYESKLYVVEKSNLTPDKDGKRYADVIAMFNMRKFYELSDILREQKETDCYIFADDGNTEILEDRYDQKLTEASIPFVISILEKILKSGETYRRIYPLLNALKAFNEQKDKWGELAVLHYGY